MWYPTHATAYYVGVTHRPFLDVTCQGTPLFDKSKRRPNAIGNIFTSEVGLFRTEEGGWTEPKNMGPAINGPELEFCPMVSPDGRWFSFSRRYGDTWPSTTDAEIYWMDASVIEALR